MKTLATLVSVVALLLAGCGPSERETKANEDERVKTGFERDIVSRYRNDELLKQCDLDDWSFLPYDLERTNSLITPYKALIEANFDGDDGSSPDPRAGEIRIDMVYQEGKWVVKEVKGRGPLLPLRTSQLPYQGIDLGDIGKIINPISGKPIFTPKKPEVPTKEQYSSENFRKLPKEQYPRKNFRKLLEIE